MVSAHHATLPDITTSIYLAEHDKFNVGVPLQFYTT